MDAFRFLIQIQEFVRTGDLNSKVVQVFWEKFSMKISPTTADETRGAVLLIGMVAGYIFCTVLELILISIYAYPQSSLLVLCFLILSVCF